jgi:RNA polymerase sigma-70 factor (ECF subfamily)
VSRGETTQIQNWIERMRAGDDLAMDELLIHFEARLIALTHKMLKDFPVVQRWEQTDDVFQGAAMRLRRALREVTPRSTREFFGLAALQVQRELLNMTETYRHQLTPSRIGKLAHGEGSGGNGADYEPVDQKDSQGELDLWTEFHDAAAALSEEIREVFHLIWYCGLSQDEAALVVGVSVRTIRGRWQEARLAIFQALDGRLPGI